MIRSVLIVSCCLFSISVVASPYVDVDYPTQVYWGDTHLHTTNSLDARTLGVALDVEDAYRFARGDTVTSTTGHTVRLTRPLDFLVVSDHSDAMGSLDLLFSGDAKLLEDPVLKRTYDLVRAGELSHPDVYNLLMNLVSGTYEGPLVDEGLFKRVWQQYVKTADRYNEPGRFTALIGYEWTPTRSGDKLHRNVLYRDGAEVAGQMLPFTAAESIRPQDLWDWMSRYETTTGGRILALAHNGNLSWGQMFPVEMNPDTGTAIDAEYVRSRARWEPLYEVTQIKGDSEAHPFLSPNDEFADFETWDRGNASMQKLTTPQMHQYEYAREALKNGLKLEENLGVNPYQFGMVGSTDSHTALSTAEESYFFGKFPRDEPKSGRLMEKLGDFGIENMWSSWEMSASGYAAVWAKENTREAIWDAMLRKEVYATTGPRMTVRFFGGWNFTESDASWQKLASSGYERGVPMGATLSGGDGRAPQFLVGALKDPMSGHLDRIQIVKGWLGADGTTHEKVFDVVWGDTHLRKVNSDGQLQPVGNTVDVANASWTNSIGDAELVGLWQDPEFDPSEPAVYYLRVLEIPTPRWTAYDVKVFGDTLPEGAKSIIQERAYSSPIWYTPQATE